MRGKRNRSNSGPTTEIAASASSNRQLSSGAQAGMPRTPGTPSDAGALTPNPPTTPGNNNTGTMVSTSPQYVAMSADTDGASGNETELSPGNTSYTMYAVNETTGTVYGTSGGSHFYAGATNNGAGFTQEEGIFLTQSTSSNSNNNNVAMDGCGGAANITNRVSPATKRKKLPELCPLPSTQRPRRSMKRETTYYDDDNDILEDYEDVELPYGNPANSSVIMSELERLGFDLRDDSGSTSDAALRHSTAFDQLVFPGASAGPIRTSPITVQWLLENYETAEGVSLPRSTLYNHYLHHCVEHKLDPVNAASFGKLIRSVFLGLRTRRLGTRGNSKYHYYGIRLKANSPLNHVKEESYFGSNIYGSNGHNYAITTTRGGTGHFGGNGTSKRFKPSSRNDLGDCPSGNGFAMGDTSTFMEYLGDTSEPLEEFPVLELGDEECPDGVLENDLFVFRTLYYEHNKVLLETVANFNLPQFELNWKSFWRSCSDAILGSGENAVDFENILPMPKMLMICELKAAQNFVRKVDFKMYQHIVEMLLPDVLRPIPSAMTQAIRNFAKVLETWLTSSMTGYPEEMVSVKVAVVNALAQTLRRYTSLNHLAQAARAVLQNQNQITQMLADLNRVDFRIVEEQASWVCGCMGNTVPSIEQDFKNTLAQQRTLDEWGEWLEKVVDKILKPFENKPNFVQSARHTLLKWSFYSSLIIRDLTLRSAASFGSFHLLRLLYDEYIFYLIEHRVAKAMNVVPIEVIGKATSGMDLKHSPAHPECAESILAPDVRDAPLKNKASLSNGVQQTPKSSLMTPEQHSSNSNSTVGKTEMKRVKNFLTH